LRSLKPIDAHSPVLVPGGIDISLRHENDKLLYRQVELMAAFQLSRILDVTTLDLDRQLLLVFDQFQKLICRTRISILYGFGETFV
jgi:hypothetical protein